MCSSVGTALLQLLYDQSMIGVATGSKVYIRRRQKSKGRHDNVISSAEQYIKDIAPWNASTGKLSMMAW